MLVDEAAGVQGLNGGDEAGGDLAGLFEGEWALAQDVGEAGVGGLHDGVDDGGAVEDGVAEFLEGDEVGLMQVVHGLPAVEDLGVIVDGFDEAKDGGGAGAVMGREKCAAALGPDELFDG